MTSEGTDVTTPADSVSTTNDMALEVDEFTADGCVPRSPCITLMLEECERGVVPEISGGLVVPIGQMIQHVIDGLEHSRVCGQQAQELLNELYNKNFEKFVADTKLDGTILKLR